MGKANIKEIKEKALKYKNKITEKTEEFFETGRREKVYAILVIFLVLVYSFLALLIIHYFQINLESPFLSFYDKIDAAFRDLLRHPFRIFPIPQKALSTTGMLLLLFTTLGAIILIHAKLRAHDNPDTVQGDAEWMKNLNAYNKKFTEPFGSISHDGKNNMILSQEMFMSMNNQKIRRNMNTFVIGGSGAGKSFNYVGPNVMQANCSYIITDPSGSLYSQYGAFLEGEGYKVKCFNLSHMDKGNRYNPFHYIHSDKDVEVLVTTLISNTTPPEKSSGDPFWEKSETALLVALIAYLYHYVDEEEQNFSNVMRLLRYAEINEEDSNQKSKLDYMFEDVAKSDPGSFAYKQYRTFKMGAGKTLKSILISCSVRLQAFDLKDVADLTDTDNIELDYVGDEKTALFIIIPTAEKTFNFLAAMMYSQLFQRAYDYCENTASFSQLVMDGDDQVIRCYRAESRQESFQKAEEAEAFLERAKDSEIYYNETFRWYELRTKQDEMVCYRWSEEAIRKELELIQNGKVLSNGRQSNHGQRLPVHTRFILDEFANIGKIPEFPEKVATIRKYEISVAIILQSLSQIKKMYKDDWSGISGNCDTTIYLGGGADQETTEWISKLLGKETRVVLNESYGKGGGSASLNRQGVELYSPSQLRTMPEEDCLVIQKSLNAYKGKKYKSIKHPMWGRVTESTKEGGYYFDPQKAQLLYELDNRNAGTPEDEHGERQDLTEEEMMEEALDRKEAAQEIRENRTEDGGQVISDVKEVNVKDEELQEDVSRKRDIDSGIRESSTSFDIETLDWGLQEMVFTSQSAEGQKN